MRVLLIFVGHHIIEHKWKKIVGFKHQKRLWWAMKFHLYHIGAALSGSSPVLMTSNCVDKALLINHCSCQIFTPRAEVFKQGCTGVEYKSCFCFYKLFGLLTIFLLLHLLFPHQRRLLSWFSFLTGPMNLSSAKYACLSASILTCERGVIIVLWGS